MINSLVSSEGSECWHAMSVFLFLVFGLVGLCYYLVKKRYSYWADRGFLSPPSIFPFGSLKGIGTSVCGAEGIDVIYTKFKGKAPVIGTYFFFNPTLLPIDPEIFKSILVRDFSSFTDRGFYYNKEDEPVSANLLSLQGQEWRDRRVKLSPIFTSGKMKMMFNTVDTISDRLVNVINSDLEKSKTLEMRVLAAKFTADVIGNVAFGLECKCLEDPDSEFFKQGRRLFDLTPYELIKFFLCSGFPDLARKLHLTISPKEAADFFLNTFLQTMEYREKNNVTRNDFVSMLLGLKEHFSPTELAAESFLVYGGGFETSSTLMTFTMYELALNPDIQTRVRDEIESALDQNEGKMTYEILFGLQYLDMVINESLRKYPPIPNLNRECTKDYDIPGTDLRITKGTSIELATYSLHHDPEYYPEPSKFIPERFTPENVKARNSFTFLPFGEGPRNCIGMRFGMMQSKLGIVKIIQNFELSPSDKTPIPMKFVPSTPFLAPVGGMHLNLKKI